MIGHGSFAQFVWILEAVKATTSKNEKVRLLSDYLRNLDERDAQLAARFATGRASPKGSADETQVGYSTLLEVLQELTGLTPSDMSRVYLKYGDLGDLAHEVLREKKETQLFTSELTLAEVADSFEKITKAKGKGSSSTKKGYLKSLLLRANPVEARYLVKILTREMRIGLVDGLVEEAISRAYSIDKASVREAHLLLGDVGLLARSASSGSIQEVRLQKLRPTNFMLAEPMQSAEEIAGYFGRELYAEYKYDGVRAQIHKSGREVRIFSRRLEEISRSFPEIAALASSIRRDFILDGEIVAFKDGRPLPFQLLQRRLRRIEDSAVESIPVSYFAFDILLLDDRELFKEPLRVRRDFLGRTIVGSGLLLAESRTVLASEEIEERFRSSRALGYEGLVVKDPESPYTPGKRGRWWVKLKEELDTVDAVIVRAEYGHGKRAGVISDYTFAVRDTEDGSLKVIGKAYSGVTDKEIEELTAKIKGLTTEDHGYWREVSPSLVIEVAFDSVQRSERHDSGFALRFPRIKRIRYDKSLKEIDTLDRVREIYGAQRVRL